MAGLAGDLERVLVQDIIGVGHRGVAGLALHAVAVHGGDGIHLAEHLVLAGGVAIDALHVLAFGRHVHVHVAGRIEQRLFQVAVLHVVAAAAEEVAGAAVGALGLADVLRDVVQIHGGIGHSGAVDFDIGVAVVVAGQAVHVVGILEIEGGAVVAVADVTLVAALLVAGDADAEVVQDVPLADGADALAFDVLRCVPSSSGRTASLPYGARCGRRCRRR